MAGARSSALLIGMLVPDVKEDLLLAQADELYGGLCTQRFEQTIY